MYLRRMGVLSPVLESKFSIGGAGLESIYSNIGEPKKNLDEQILHTSAPCDSSESIVDDSGACYEQH